MTIKNHPVLGLLFILGYPISTHAQLSASVTGTTDYIWRGYSKSDEKPAAQLNIDYGFKSGLYLGTSASTVNFADQRFAARSDAEFKPYAGWAYQLSDDWRFNAEWVRYIFTGKIFGQSVDYNEFYLHTHFRDLLSANFSFSENGYQQNHMSFNYEIIGRYPITSSIEMSGTFGYSQQKKVLHYDYLYWTSGVTWHFSPNIGVDVRYYSGLDLGAEKEHIAGWQFRPHVVDNRVLFSITAGF